MCVYIYVCVFVCVLIFRRQPTQVYTIYVFKQAQAVSRNDNLLTAVMRFQQNVLFFLVVLPVWQKQTDLALNFCFWLILETQPFRTKQG